MRGMPERGGAWKGANKFFVAESVLGIFFPISLN
jgi:hypothetical protein